MDKILYLINYLAKERKINIGELPNNEKELKDLFRSLMNTRPANDISEDYLKIEDEFLQEELNKKTIVDIENLNPIKDKLYIWKGDITTLKIDAIVNAANSSMLGCFYPLHKCIDNAIHSAAGTRLRLFCRDIINGGYLNTGETKITPAFNLPCKYVLHTVGPIIKNKVSKEDEDALYSCYNSSLKLALENNIKSLAFCCISTGEFRFPNDLASSIALSSVNDFLNNNKNDNKNRDIKIVFNVFKDIDCELYYKKIIK